MSTVRVSPKYQVVIPRDVRERAALTPGQPVEVFFLDGRIQIVPVRPIAEMKGFLAGIDTTVVREDDRDL